MPLQTYILDGNWNPVLEPDLLKWGEWLEARQRAGTLHVADELVGEVRVSTKFIGLPHLGTGDPPLLFETLVFGGDLDLQGEWYATRQQAQSGHKEWVEVVKELQAT